MEISRLKPVRREKRSSQSQGNGATHTAGPWSGLPQGAAQAVDV